MGGEKAEAPKPLEIGVSRDVVRRHHKLEQPTPGDLARHMAINRKVAAVALQEHKVKLQEGGDSLSLLVEAATIKKEGEKNLPDDDESCCLTDDERKAYCETVDQCVDEEGSTPEDKEALRVTMMEVIFKPKVFRIHYKEWKAAWDSSPALQGKYPDLKDYVLARAKAFIRARRNEVVSSRLRRFQKDSLPKAASEDQQKAQLKEIQRKTLRFIKDHEDELLEYTSLDEADPKRQVLLRKFIYETGLQGAQLAAAKELFEEIINDIEVAYAAIKKLEARNGKMVDKAQKSLDDGKDIDEDEWNKMLDDALKDDPFFKEIMQQQQAASYQASGAEAGPARAPLDSVQAVALQAGGLLITGYDPATDTYTVRYPDSSFYTHMKIVPKPGSKNYDDATFIFDHQYADKDKGGKVSLTGDDLRRGCNQMYLDRLMFDLVKAGEVSPDFSMNDILKDQMSLSMAERLFGRSLNEVVLTKKMREIFTRFLEVVMKGDSSSSTFGDLGSFDKRVKKMDVVLNNKEYAGALRREFEKVGSVAFTMSTMLEHIGYHA